MVTYSELFAYTLVIIGIVGFTYSELFAYTLVIIGIVGLMLQIANKK